ncbi:hypothetical protein HYC85_028810 [Camellia sinensis]|uniref:Uncharacterized protein n=1 Tax=Camellia sinensis TaxID=4442 RepID=A0A7J7FWF2_CAMSI|nr:hypothetical protein HYC85_028810 [Camellia sinensis]
MANSKEAHVVEIPIDEEHQPHKLISTIQNHPLMEISQSPEIATVSDAAAANVGGDLNPRATGLLTPVVTSVHVIFPGIEGLFCSSHNFAICNVKLCNVSGFSQHLLLLKLLQREEHLCARRITIKETRKDTIGREIFQLCFFFFIFHSLFSIILFTSTTKNQNDYKSLCKKWWVPSILLVLVSIVVIFLVQIKLWRYWEVERELQRERSDGRAVTRWIQEMRMKGASFDLSKESQGRRGMQN